MKKSTLIPVVSGMVALCVSCGQVDDQSTNLDETVPSSEAAAATVELEQPDLYFDETMIEVTGPLNDLDIQSTVVDADDYEMTFHLTNRFANAKLDLANDKPGRASIKLEYESELTITNDLPNHDIYFGNVNTSAESLMTVSAIWPSSSKICQAYLGCVSQSA